MNKTTDVYLNGKLARSCILDQIPNVDFRKDNVHVLARDPNSINNKDNLI